MQAESVCVCEGKEQFALAESVIVVDPEVMKEYLQL